MNRALLIGNLTKDPEMITTQNGINMTKFTVACQRKFTNEDGERDCDFINCIAWRASAEFIHKYFKKGNKIAIVGTIQTRSYDAEDGTKRYVTEVVVEESEFVQSKKTDDSQVEDTKTDLTPVDDDKLPF